MAANTTSRQNSIQSIGVSIRSSEEPVVATTCSQPHMISSTTQHLPPNGLPNSEPSIDQHFPATIDHHFPANSMFVPPEAAASPENVINIRETRIVNEIREIAREAQAELERRIGELSADYRKTIDQLKRERSSELKKLRKTTKNEKDEAVRVEADKTATELEALRSELKDVREARALLSNEKFYLTKDLDEATTKIEGLEGEVERLESEVEAATAANERLEIEKDDAENSKNDLEIELQDLERKLTTAVEAKSKVERRASNLQAQLNAMDDFEEQSVSLRKELEEQNQQSKKDLAASKAECDEIQTKYDASQAELAKFTTAFKESNEEKINLQWKFNNQKPEIAGLNHNLSEADKAKTALEARKSTVQTELETEKESTTKLREELRAVKAVKSMKEQTLGNAGQQKDKVIRNLKWLDHLRIHASRLSCSHELLQKVLLRAFRIDVIAHQTDQHLLGQWPLG